MTGFGNAQVSNPNLQVSVEVKSLNSKSLDLNVRLPRNFPSEKELEIRNIIKDKLERGKVSVYVEMQYLSEPAITAQINTLLVKAYLHQLLPIAKELNLDTQGLMSAVLTFPDVLIPTHKDEEKMHQEWQCIEQALNEALQKCYEFRLQEGKMLEHDFRESIEQIQNLLAQVEQYDSTRIAQIRMRIQNRMTELLNHEKFDMNRFEQEMIYYIEKLDISEEKARLRNHLTYFLQIIDSPEPSGRKLNFIAQEIGREINTMGAKANDSQLQQWVVLMKEELEKIKEQVQNIL